MDKIFWDTLYAFFLNPLHFSSSPSVESLPFSLFFFFSLPFFSCNTPDFATDKSYRQHSSQNIPHRLKARWRLVASVSFLNVQTRFFKILGRSSIQVGLDSSAFPAPRLSLDGASKKLKKWGLQEISIKFLISKRLFLGLKNKDF